MPGKTVLITGATNGIGLEAAVTLAQAGARVVMVGRDPGRTEAAAAGVMARSGSRGVSHLLCDFSSQAAIRMLAELEGVTGKHFEKGVAVTPAPLAQDEAWANGSGR